MASRQLKSRDLKAGDIFLKVNDGSVLGKAIELGQSLTGGKNARVIHAGLMFDKTIAIESQGPGITAHDMRVQNKRYGYLHLLSDLCQEQDRHQGLCVARQTTRSQPNQPGSVGRPIVKIQG